MIPAAAPIPRSNARILLVGVGGIGSPAALALAAAGVGQLTLLDDDDVSPSNLHRQILYRAADAGRPKVESAAAVLRSRHPNVSVTPIRARFDVPSALHHLAGHDLVLDGTDSFAAKYLLNDVCTSARLPFVHAGAVRWSGQLLAVRPGDPCLRCVFPAPPASPGDGMSCREQGIVGPVVGTIGALAASAALAILDGSARGGCLFTYQGIDGSLRTIHFRRDPECPTCGLRRTSPLDLRAGEAPAC